VNVGANVSVQFSDVLLYASRSVTSPVQFKVHGKLPVSGVSVSSRPSSVSEFWGIKNRDDFHTRRTRYVVL